MRRDLIPRNYRCAGVARASLATGGWAGAERSGEAEQHVAGHQAKQLVRYHARGGIRMRPCASCLSRGPRIFRDDNSTHVGIEATTFYYETFSVAPKWEYRRPVARKKI